MFEDIMSLDVNQSELFYGNESLDSDVQITAEKCSQEGKITSMIKLELKTKIQLQKLNKGEDFNVEWRKETIGKLTPEDLERRQNLRERNKLSARKHRIKKKQENLVQQKDVEELLKRNAFLKQQIEKLELAKKESDKLWKPQAEKMESVNNEMYYSFVIQS